MKELFLSPKTESSLVLLTPLVYWGRSCTPPYRSMMSGTELLSGCNPFSSCILTPNRDGSEETKGSNEKLASISISHNSPLRLQRTHRMLHCPLQTTLQELEHSITGQSTDKGLLFKLYSENLPAEVLDYSLTLANIYHGLGTDGEIIDLAVELRQKPAINLELHE